MRGADGTFDIYAHMEPDSVVLKERDWVDGAQVIGRYADPPNGVADGAHLHFERRDAARNSLQVDWSIERFPVAAGGRMTSGFGRRFHPVYNAYKSHKGYDFVGLPN